MHSVLTDPWKRATTKTAKGLNQFQHTTRKSYVYDAIRRLELMPQFIADVLAIMARLQTSLEILPENRSTKNYFIIMPSLPTTTLIVGLRHHRVVVYSRIYYIFTKKRNPNNIRLKRLLVYSELVSSVGSSTVVPSA
eukprot:scaffold165417_cov27-Attheya_sp.AAC.1